MDKETFKFESSQPKSNFNHFAADSNISRNLEWYQDFVYFKKNKLLKWALGTIYPFTLWLYNTYDIFWSFFKLKVSFVASKMIS